MNLVSAVVQAAAVAVAVLGDKSTRPLIPRWVGYFNLWVILLFLPGGLATFFKTGAFAWNGLLAFWLAAVVFGLWYVVMTVMLRRAIRAPDPVDELQAA